jgi:two-component system sensor histidine kinase KdpD
VIRTWLRTAIAQRRAWSGLTVASAGLAVATLILLPWRTDLSAATVGLLFLLPVVVTAVVGDRWSCLLTVVVADLLVNFFFIPPYHTLLVQRGDDLVLLGVYLLVALSISVAVDVAVRYRTTADTLAGQADRLADIDRLRTALLAAVSHDLRTPLAGIKAATSTLRQPNLRITPGERIELLAAVEDSTDRLSGLVDNLLSASRLQAGELSAHPEPVAMDGVAAAALVATGADAVLDIPDDLPLVLADAALLEHVIINLVRNAEDADPARPVRLTGRIAGDRAQLAVIDRGPGADPVDWPRMFVPFQRLRDHPPPARHGLGLGLTVVKGFTEAMGGTVTPSRTPGGGLTMTVSLPLAASQAAEEVE